MTAEIFAAEANVVNPDIVAIESPEGFLKEWWVVFYEKFCSNLAKCALEPYSEAARTVDNVEYHIRSATPGSSPHFARLADDISPLVPAFHLRTPEAEALFDLMFLEMDRPSPSQSQRVPYVTESSRPMEQIPNNTSTVGGQR
ncbi:uncharacterized protein LOC129894146 [Solanum dulcamara]|uniref:uncharacterized protein LOC129894146 n=1 Tax=Solanum dulcamara TaxID=45834 RepID=UPI002486142C|nr:uncharacterized protein LOC129894146 [Solanum dulcamara]XP_055825662.1 uncharacterized protein LOC129894146 [Solanum dulcamara]